MNALNSRAMINRNTEATNGPPTAATYSSPPQNTAIEITRTKIQTNVITKFLFSTLSPLIKELFLFVRLS